MADKTNAYDEVIKLVNDIVSTGTVSKASGGSSSASGSQTAEKAATKSTNTSDYFARRRKALGLDRINVDADYISSFLDDSQRYMRDAVSARVRMGVGTSQSIYESRKRDSDDLHKRSFEISRYLEKNKDKLDEEAYKSLKDYLDSFDQSSSQSIYSFYRKNEFYSQFESKEDYDKYIAQKEEYESKVNLDLDAANQEIEDLQAKREDYAQNHEFDWSDASQRDAYNKALEEMDAQIAQKKQYLNQARNLQESVKLSSVSGESDFRERSQYRTTIGESTSWLKGRTEDTQYEWINNQDGFRDSYESDMEALNSIAGATTQSSFYMAPVESWYSKKGYDHLTQDEIAIYNYYYAKDGKEKAQEYLDSIQETLNYRKATEMYGKMEDQTALELAFGVKAGLDQFTSGISSFFNFEDDYIPQSAVQMASGMVREDLGDAGAKLPDWMGGASIGQAGYDAITTTANMAPSILASIAVGMLNPAAGQVTGQALMGMSAAGGAYQEALNAGYDKNQARGYGLLVGASEIVMEKLLGGISAFGGNALGKTLTKNLSNADTALKMIAKKLGGSMLSEFGEEYLQEVLTPVFKNLTLGTNEDVRLFSPEALYSGILGALTAGIMEGPTAIAGEVNTYRTGKQLQNADISAKRLAEIGTTFSADTVAYQLAGKVDENTGAYAMGRLFNEINATLTEQNKSEITQYLQNKGMSEDVAKKNAEVLAYIVDGGEVSDIQKRMIDKNTVLASAMQEVIIDSNSTVNQRTQGFNQVLMSLANEVSGVDTSQTEQATPGQDSQVKADKVVTENKQGAQSEYEASEDGKTVIKSTGEAVDIQGVASIKDGQMTLKLADGRTVDAKDIDYASQDEALVYAAVSKMDVSAETAWHLIKDFDASKGVSAEAYAIDLPLAYKYGKLNYKAGLKNLQLTPEQGLTAFYRGRNDAQVETKAKVAADANKVGSKKATVGKELSKKEIIFEGFTYDEKNAKDLQKAGIAGIDMINKMSNLEVHVYESFKKNGKYMAYIDGKLRVAPNGYFTDGNKIYIDINAGKNGEGAMLYTMSHEVGHYIAEWNAEDFQAISDFLFEHYGEDVPIYEMLKKQREKVIKSYKMDGKALPSNSKLEALAQEELVCDMLSRMFADENAYVKLAELKQENLTLFEKLGQAIKKLLDKLKDIIGVYSGQSPDAQYVAGVDNFGKEAFEKLQDLYIQAFVKADENYQSTLPTEDVGVTVNQTGESVVQPTAETVVQPTAESVVDTQKQQVQPQAQTQPVQQPQAVQKEAPKKIYFHYDSISDHPYFNESQGRSGEKLNFSINDDNSIDLDTTGEDGLYNNMTGWMENEGLGKLYNVYADGQLVTNPKAARGYYSLANAEITARPVLQKNVSGNLLPDQKGEIHFYSDNFNKSTQSNQNAQAQQASAPVTETATQPSVNTQPQQAPAVQRTAQTTANRQETSTKTAEAEKEFAEINQQFGYKPKFTRPLDPDKLNEAHLARGSGYNNMPPSLNGNRPETDIGKALFQIARFPEKYGGRRIPYNESKQYLSRSGVVADAIIPLRDDIHIMFGSSTGNSGYDSVHYQKDAYNVVPSVIGENNKMIFDGNGESFRPYDSFDREPREYFGISKSELAQLPIIQKARSDYNEQLKEDGNIRDALYRLGDRTPEYIDATRPLYDQFVSIQDSAYEITPGEEGVAVNKSGEPVAYSTEDGSVMFSMRTYEEDGRKVLRDYLNKCVSSNKLTKAEMQEMMDGIEEIYQTCKEFKDKYAPFSSWSDATVVRDTYGKPVFSVVTPNGDYKMNLDFSLVCKKRRTLDAVFNEMSRRGIIDNFELGQKSVVKINEIIRRHGLETACALCFVDAKRFRQASMADQFTSLYNELVLSLVPEGQRSSIEHFNFGGYETIKKVDGGIHTWSTSKLDFSHLDEVMKKYGKGTVEHKAAKYIKSHPEGRKLLLRGDFMSSQGFDAVKTQNKDILKLYNSKKGTGGPKAAFGDVQYMNEIVKKARTWTPEKAYAVGGVRIQSFSDYVPRMVFDYAQMIYDLAATKLPAHAYTKEAMFVKQFGLTGVKINMSLIPAIADGGIAPGLDANGDYVWAGESFDYETAKEIQNAEGYTENCGTICVGVSKKHIEKLLADPNIRMVIPYHKSGLNPIVAHMNKIAEFTDYTNDQRTKGKDGKALSKDFDFSKALHDLGDKASPKAVADQYLKWCAANGYTAKFAEFAMDENYYKLLEDFTLYDKDGNYVPQREVRAVFPKADSAFGSMKELIQEGLQEDAVVEGKRDKSLSSIVDEIQQTLPKTEAEIAEEQVAQADRDLEAEVNYSEREVVKTFKNGQNAKGEFTTNMLVDLADMNSEWWTGKYNHAILGMSKTDDTEFRQFYQEILKRTKDMDEYAGSDNEIVEDSFTVQDEKGREYIYRVSLDGYLHGVVLCKIDIAKHERAMKRYERGKPYGRSYADISRRTANARNEMERYSTGDSRNLASNGNSGHGRLGSGTSQSNKTGNDRRRESPDKEVQTVTDTDDQQIYSDRDTDSVSNRSLLANALESVAKNDIERKRLQEYKEKIKIINAEEVNLRAINQQLRIEKDPENIRVLQFEANQAANRINTYDRQLLRLEASRPLQDVLTREKKMAYDRGVKKGKEALDAYRARSEKKQQEIIERYQESRKRGVENRQKTALRQKIRGVIRDLDKILNRGDKKRNVKEDMKDFVADALATAEILFTESYTNEDMVRNGVSTDLTPEEAKFMNEARAIMDEIANLPTGYEGWQARQEQEAKLKGRLAYRMGKLKDVFVRERARLNKTQVSEVLGNLADSYARLQNSEYAHVQGAYHESVHEYLKMLQEDVGGTIIKDMTIGQLEELYKAYTMVKTTVYNANRMFADNLNNTREALANRVMFEVHEAGGEHGLWSKAGDKLNSFSWNNEKPVYAFERIGSKTLSTLYGNIRKGQDGWAVDIQEANDFRMKMYQKYKHSTWDKLKTYKFTSSSGIDFELNLDQIMSLYAYSRRAQAHDHLLKGGFVFDGNTEVVVNKKGLKMTFLNKTATAYNVSFEILEDIISKLTPEQKAFADEMQEYLSTTMGEKGNEVSMELYGVKLFNEKFYFPLRSAGQYMEKAKEADMKQKQGQVNIANSGFSKAVKIKASNPVVLTGFMDVWAGHVNEMSMYHSFVLPMEDFRRVYNYSSPHMEGQQSASVNGVIQNAYGAAATDYIDQLYRDLNGGALTDSRTGPINKLMGLFKKGAVFASASVTVQQPSAVARATALVDVKHFIGPRVDAKRHKALWEEVKQYAPVAVIKEMGFFDTNMGRSATDFLTAEEYSGIKEKALALVKDESYRDEQLSKAPALADELTWCVIWEAVKRETKARNPGMNVQSEEFLKLAGDRFSEVVDKTQVYDSVLARSAHMRSKDTGMKMATAFMAEPTTSINMIADALRKGKKGNKKQAARIIGSVVSSVILNSFLVAWVYAARDDDEDETFREKYISAFLSGIRDGVNPATYIPFLKDVVSIMQGYDVERSDMAVISDLWSAYQKLGRDDVSAWMKVEGFVGSICQIFGLPVKNIMRDVRSLYQAYNTVFHGEENTTRGTAIAIVEGITGEKPSNSEQLYKARVRGDEKHAARVEARYDDEDSANAAVRKAITDRYMAGELTLAQATMQLTQYAGMKADEAYWLMDGWRHKKETGSDDYNKYDAFYEAVRTGKNLKTVIKEYTDHGVKASTLSGQITSHFKEDYVAMSAGERANIKGYLINAFEQCGVSRENAEEKLREWDFEAKYGGSYNDIVENYKNGTVSEATMRNILAERGYSKSEIEDKISDWNAYKIYGYEYSKLDDAYRAGEISREEFRQAMIENGTFPAKADQAIIVYDWMRDNAQYGLEYSDAAKYALPIENYGYSLSDVGLDPDIYLEYKELKKECQGVDGDNDGKADSGTLRTAKFEMIDSLPISNDQKDALAAIDYGMKSIRRYAPWH